MNTELSYDKLLRYDLGKGVEAFSTRRDSVLPYPVVTGHQVHETRIAVIDSQKTSLEDLEGYDAFVTDKPGIAIGVRTADCVPVLLYDPVKQVVAAIHAGWKGTVQRITQKTVVFMQQKFGTSPEGIKAMIGPSISPDSFQVGEEVVLYFKEQGFPLESIWFFNEGKGESPMYHGHHIDIWKANAWLLEQSGVNPVYIQKAGIDTYTDGSFFSARREGVTCGRIISAIKLGYPKF